MIRLSYQSTRNNILDAIRQERENQSQASLDAKGEIPVMPIQTERRSTHDPRWALALVGFCTFLGLYATQALLPTLKQLFAASEMEVSLTISAATAAVALTAPLAGLVVDRWERKPLMIASLFALAATTLLAATAPNLPALIAWRFVQGLFVPVVYVVTLCYINETCDAGRLGASMASFITGNVLGGFTGRALSGTMIELGDWRLSFVVLGGLTVVGTVAAAFLLPPSEQERPAYLGMAGIRKWGELLRSPALLGIFAAGFNTLFVLVALFTYVNFHLAEAPFHLGPMGLAAIFSVYMLGVIVTPLAGRLIDTYGYRPVFLAATATALAGVLITLLPTLWGVIAGLAICSSGVFVCQSAATSALGATSGASRSLASGLYLAFYYLGGSIGGALPGFFWGQGGWWGCVLVVICVQVLTMGIVSAFWPRLGVGVAKPAAAHS
ncbi:Inner membrane transport protein YnfM [compost metagenome]